MMWSGDWNGWGVFWMSLMMVVFWGGLIWLVVYAIRQFSGSAGRAPNRVVSALEVLEERFARGEIDRDEYEDRRRVLESKAA